MKYEIYMTRKRVVPAQRIRPRNVIKKIVSIRELLSDPALQLPTYQRPYKWTAKHINQLFSDLAFHKDKSSYRLGTIVFHQDGDTNYIVDGQQRTISLILITRALIDLRKDDLRRKDLKDLLDELGDAMVDPGFTSSISQTNIRNNYLEISRIVCRSGFTEELIDFLFNKCNVVVFSINNISEAFQFFDSQNARGRDLEPHDLLKAYHLREFNKRDAHLRSNAVASWESSETKELANLFAQYLYRIRNWSKGRSARHFGKDEIGLFKGVNIDTEASYPYVEQMRITHRFIDHCNQKSKNRLAVSKREFPFHLDQIIINGRRFFEMTSHYQKMMSKVARSAERPQMWSGRHPLNGFAPRIIKTIDTYPGRHRTGDLYVRTIFDCLLLYYIDKFGRVEISRAIEKIFVWAYSLRLRMQVVQLASMDNYVREQNNLFALIREATAPAELINVGLPVLSANYSSKTNEVEVLFKEMRYL